MREILKDVFIEEDNNTVLKFIDDLKKQGAEIPDFDLDRDNLIPHVSYGTSFNLCIFQYFHNKKDGGYAMCLIKNAFTENKLNLLVYQKMGFNIEELMLSIITQAKVVAEMINYPFVISSLISPEFVGIIATPKHPLVEIYNSDGHKN